MDNATNKSTMNSGEMGGIFSRMLLWQFGATLLVSAVAYLYAGFHAGISALLGGLIVIIAALAASKIVQRNKGVVLATSALVSLLLAEIAKILIIIFLLFLTYKLYKQLMPAALIVGLMVAAILSGAAISKMQDKNLPIR